MMKAYARRVAAGAVISAALTAGSLGLTASAMECTDPKCVSGTTPAEATLNHLPLVGHKRARIDLT